NMAQTGLCFVPASQVIERAIEELSDLVVELLDTVELERKQFVGRHAVARKVHQAVVADVSAQVLLGNQKRVHQLAHADALAEPHPSDLLVFTTYRTLVRLADPLPEVVVERGNTCLDIDRVEATESRSPLVPPQLFDHVVGEGPGVGLNQQKQTRAEHKISRWLE